MTKKYDDPGILIAVLIQARLVELGLTKFQLVQRWGYSKSAKGLRRLEQLGTGECKPDAEQWIKLAHALEMPLEAIQNAFASTQEKLRQIEEENRQRDWEVWCEEFAPHAILTTENKIPRPIHIVGIVGAERILRIGRVLINRPRPTL